MKKYVLVLVALSFVSRALAQESANYPNVFVRLNGEYGYVLPSDDFLKGNNQTGQPISLVTGGNFELGWQAHGSSPVYDPLLKYPTYGFGFLTYHFPQTTELGYPNALYMFLNAPFKRWDRWSVNYIIRLGMSYNWQPHDPVDNVANLVIGSFRNLYISFGSEGKYRFHPRWEAALGFAFAHFSNGRSSEPNSGVNLLTPHLGLSYHFNRGQEPEYPELQVPEYEEKGMEYYFTIGNGVRQEIFDSTQTGVATPIGVSYPVTNLSIAAQYQYKWTGKYGGGIDIIYWGPYNPQIEYDPASGIVQAVKHPFADHLQVGVFISYEFVLNNVSIYAQPGYRIIRKEYPGMAPDFYQHLALKYHIRDLIVGVAIRAVNFSQAEYIEWNIGYRFKRIKKNK